MPSSALKPFCSHSFSHSLKNNESQNLCFVFNCCNIPAVDYCHTIPKLEEGIQLLRQALTRVNFTYPDKDEKNPNLHHFVTKTPLPKLDRLNEIIQSTMQKYVQQQLFTPKQTPTTTQEKPQEKIDFQTINVTPPKAKAKANNPNRKTQRKMKKRKERKGKARNKEDSQTEIRKHSFLSTLNISSFIFEHALSSFVRLIYFLHNL
jgi:hypothetical protein